MAVTKPPRASNSLRNMVTAEAEAEAIPAVTMAVDIASNPDTVF
jgi:hypothetical protein